MAFWGAVVTPSNPFVHSCKIAKGRRLRITQVTIAGYSSERCDLQCKVGDRMPLLICSMFPGSLPSMHLELEFEEMEDVVFSVVGERNIYLNLTGYYVQQNHTQSHDRNCK